MEIDTVFVVPYCHIDWAWRNTRRYFVHRNRQVLFAALDFLDAEPAYRWSGIHKSHVLADFWEAYPSLREKLARAVREGRVDLGGSAHFTPLTCWVEEEIFFRNLLYGHRFFEERFGPVRDPVLYFADVPVTFAQVPQVARKFGFEYTIIDRPSEALERKGIPRQFRWQGLDGSELLADRTFYGRTFPGTGGNHVSCSPGSFPALAERTRKVLAYLAHDAAARVLYLPDSCDWAFPTLNLPEFVTWWNTQAGAPPMRIATHTEYFDALAAERERLPVVSGNVDPVGWNGFYGSDGERPNTLLRRVHNELLLAERTAILARVVRGAEYPEGAFERLFSQLGVLYCHGGYSTAMVFPEDYAAVEAELQQIREEAVGIRTEATAAALETESGWSVFGPLPWAREEWLELDGRPLRVGAAPLCWTRVTATDPPEPVAGGPDWIENEHLRVEFGPAGIRCARDKARGRALWSDARGGTVAMDRGKINLLTANFLESDDARFEAPVIHSEGWRALAVQRGSVGPNGVTLTAELRAGERLLRLRVAVQSRETDRRYRLCLPLAAGPAWRLYADDLCAMTERGLEGEPMLGLTRSNPVEGTESPLEGEPPPAEGTNRGAFYGINLALAHDGSYGVALLNAGTVGYVWEEAVLSNILLRTVHPKALDQYAPATYLTGLGEYAFEVAVFADASASLAPFLRAARDFAQPLLVARGTPGALAGQPTVTCSAENVILSGLHLDGGEIALRAYELEGRVAECVFRFSQAPAAAWETDFRGERRVELALSGAEVRVRFRPWEIKELRVG